jgi:hypothetical protein
MDFLVDMFGTRDPEEGELEFFKKRPEVAGMATEDNKIILNPYSKNTAEEQQAVAKNEAFRLFMKMQELVPSFELTKEQQEFFKDTEYEKDTAAAKQTILARILSGDPSAKNATPEQLKEAKQLEQEIMKLAPIANPFEMAVPQSTIPGI